MLGDVSIVYYCSPVQLYEFLVALTQTHTHVIPDQLMPMHQLYTNCSTNFSYPNNYLFQETYVSEEIRDVAIFVQCSVHRIIPTVHKYLLTF